MQFKSIVVSLLAATAFAGTGAAQVSVISPKINLRDH